jgi:hypothetical protein
MASIVAADRPTHQVPTPPDYRPDPGFRLGRFNGQWWRARQAMAIRSDWFPDQWALDPTSYGEVITVELILDVTNITIVATYRGHSVIYEPGPDLDDWSTAPNPAPTARPMAVSLPTLTRTCRSSAPATGGSPAFGVDIRCAGALTLSRRVDGRPWRAMRHLPGCRRSTSGVR